MEVLELAASKPELVAGSKNVVNFNPVRFEDRESQKTS